METDPGVLEVLSFLGWRGQALSPELMECIHQARDDCRRTAGPQHIWRIFDCVPEEGAVHLAGTGLYLRGEAIQRHLACARRAAVLAVTLGVGADNAIRFWNHRDLTRCVCQDACCSLYVEEVADRATQEIREEAQRMNLTVTSRFSPGYGDFSLDIQQALLDVLDAGRRIGLTCTKAGVLLPRKSVTAVVGLVPQESGEEPGGCAVCDMRETCRFRKDGTPAGPDSRSLSS